MQDYTNLAGLVPGAQYAQMGGLTPISSGDNIYKPAESYIPTLPESQGLRLALPSNQNPNYVPSLFDGHLGSTIMGNTMQDGFQGKDIVSWGKNLFGAADQSMANFGETNIAKAIGLGSREPGDAELPDSNKFNSLWGGLESLTSLYQGYKTAQLQRDQHNLKRDAWNESWAANKKAMNENVAHRAMSKFSDNPQKMKEYEQKYSIA